MSLLSRGSFRPKDRVMTRLGWGELVEKREEDQHWEVKLQRTPAWLPTNLRDYIMHPEDTIRHETFWEYLKHFGQFDKHIGYAILATILSSLGQGIVTWSDGGWFVVIVAAVVTTATMYTIIKEYIRQ